MALVILAGIPLGLCVYVVAEFFWPKKVATAWDEIAGWFGDWSPEATEPTPLDWADFPEWQELRELSRRLPENANERSAA